MLTQLNQLSALNRDTRLVTLTVGGNNLDVSGPATSCLAKPAGCIDQIDIRLSQLDDLGSDLIDLYADAISASLPRGWVDKQKQLD